MTYLLTLLIVTTLAYLPVTTAGFVYEDTNPRAALDPTQPPDNRGPWQGWETERGHFQLTPRMLSNVTMRLQGWHQDQAFGFHVVNLAIHELNGVLFWLLVLPLGTGAAFGATGVYLLHPISSQAVNYVSARPDLLYGTCVLLTLLATRIPGWWGVALVTLCGGLAILAKETAVVIVALVPLWLWFQRRWRACWWIPLGIWTTAGLVCAYRLLHVSAKEGAPPWSALAQYTDAAPMEPATYAAMQAAAIWNLLSLIVWPSGFSVDHDVDLVPVGLAVVALLGLAGLLAGAWQTRFTAPALAFGIAWVLVALSLRFVIPLPEYVHEHHLYVPCLGIWLALAVGVASIGSRLQESV